MSPIRIVIYWLDTCTLLKGNIRAEIGTTQMVVVVVATSGSGHEPASSVGFGRKVRWIRWMMMMMMMSSMWWLLDYKEPEASHKTVRHNICLSYPSQVSLLRYNTTKQNNCKQNKEKWTSALLFSLHTEIHFHRFVCLALNRVHFALFRSSGSNKRNEPQGVTRQKLPLIEDGHEFTCWEIISDQIGFALFWKQLSTSFL